MTNTDDRSSVVFGIVLILATALTISVQDLVFKLFYSDLTLWQIFTLRGLLAISMLLAISAFRGRIGSVAQGAVNLWSALRAACLTATFLAFYAAVPFLSLATVGAANYVAPIFVAILSSLVIGQRVGRQGWLGVVLGFVGVLALLQPNTDAFSAFALLPLVGAAFYAVGHIITRTKCQHIPASSLALSLNVVMCLAGVVISLVLFLGLAPAQFAESYPYIFGGWAKVELSDWLVLMLLAGFTVAIGMMLAAAYQVAPPVTISTFEYSYLVFVALWDIIFFDNVPTLISLIGMAMIVLAGLLVLWR